MIIRPRYIDLDLVWDLLDHLGYEIPESMNVRRTSADARDRHVGIDHGVAAGMGAGRSSGREETYTTPVRPVQLVKQALEGLREEGDLINVAEDPEAAIAQRRSIEVSGVLSTAPGSEVAPLFQAVFGALQESGVEDLGELPEAEILRRLMGSGPPSAPTVMTLDPDPDIGQVTMILRPSGLYRVDSFDDLEGDMTVFGVVDRVLGDGPSVSLDRYMFPGLNRTMRRAISGKALDRLLDDLRDHLDQPIDRDDLAARGPGAIVSAAAIYP